MDWIERVEEGARNMCVCDVDRWDNVLFGDNEDEDVYTNKVWSLTHSMEIGLLERFLRLGCSCKSIQHIWWKRYFLLLPQQDARSNRAELDWSTYVRWCKIDGVSSLVKCYSSLFHLRSPMHHPFLQNKHEQSNHPLHWICRIRTSGKWWSFFLN